MTLLELFLAKYQSEFPPISVNKMLEAMEVNKEYKDLKHCATIRYNAIKYRTWTAELEARKSQTSMSILKAKIRTSYIGPLKDRVQTELHCKVYTLKA